MPAVKKEKNDPIKSKREICNPKKVKEAVNALKLLNKKFMEEDLKKQPLLEDTAESPIYLQVMLKKIPPPQLIRMIKVTLPHTMMTETSEVCLITGDLDKRNHKTEVEPTILHYKDLLKKHGVTKVAQVIPLRQLRTEYKTYESKRQLAAAYDVFLADKKIAGVIPKTLGKSFFQNRKFPVQIDLRKQNLKDQIDKALCKTEFFLTCRGNSYALEVARLSMDDDAIVGNLMTSVEVLANKLPGNEDNILSLYLKTAKSKAIPIFVSLDIPDDLLIKKPRKNERYKLGELSTRDDTEVKVFKSGKVIVRKTKKDSVEKDEDAAENESFSALIESEEETQESVDNKVSSKKKKKSGKDSDLIETTNDAEMKNEEDFQDSVANKSFKKKKKGKKSIGLNEVADISLVENEEIQDSIVTEISSKKKKKGKKSIGIDEVTNKVENEDIQESIAAEISSKKKKKGKKSLDEVADVSQVEHTEVEDSITTVISSKKKKGKKSVNSSCVEADEALEDIRESSMLLKSKKRKIHESDNLGEIAQKSKNVVDAAKMESIITVEDEEIILDKQTPLRSKKGKKESIGSAIKRKNANVDGDVKNSLELNKRRKSDRKSMH